MVPQASRPADRRECLATKADLVRAINTLTWRFIGLGVVTAVLGLLIRLWG